MCKNADMFLAAAEKNELLGKSSRVAMFMTADWQAEADNGARYYDKAIQFYRAALRALEVDDK